MNVLINWQSGADTRLIENVSLSTNNFHCLEPYADFHLWQTCHMPLKLLTINKNDNTAIHHVILVYFFSAEVCSIVLCACHLHCVFSCLWFYESIHTMVKFLQNIPCQLQASDSIKKGGFIFLHKMTQTLKTNYMLKN